MIRVRLYLESKGLWDAGKQKAEQERAEVMVKEVVDKVLNWPAPKREEMFDHLYSEMPALLRQQRDSWATHSLGMGREAGLQSGSAAGSHQHA